jgi:hypothetical protein
MQAISKIQGVFGAGASDTVMHPVVAVAMVATIVAMFGLPRKYIVVPFLLALFLLPVGQQFYIGGVHFYVPRILIGFGLARLVSAKLKSRARILPGGWNDLDKIFTCWAICRFSAGVLYYWSGKAFPNQLAFLWDTLGGYYLLRFLIRDKEDIGRVAKTFGVIVGILGSTMLVERFRDFNVFGYFGSIPIVPAVREGVIRAQGPFEHPILAGAFAATLLPFFLWLWHSRESRILGAIGIGGCTAMVFSCASSTPLLSYAAVFLGLCFWPLRGKMRIVQWGLLIGVVTLHLIMKAPVWFLIARINLVGGNSGYHRAELIDVAIRHFRDWWLCGTDQAVNWGFEMDDNCEQWVAEAESGGLATLVCFILLVALAFRRIGNALKRASQDRKRQWMLWFIGVALFSHVVGFFGISYFDQTRFAWYALLCIISVVTIRKASTPEPARSKLPTKTRIKDDGLSITFVASEIREQETRSI